MKHSFPKKTDSGAMSPCGGKLPSALEGNYTFHAF